jgi:anti-sigma B factor antagonist
MSVEQPILEVYQAGPTTVVGFGGRDVFDEINIAACRGELLELIAREDCQALAVDLTGVKLLPSGLLGVLTSIYKRGVAVHVYNPSDDVKEVLETTRLNTMIQVHEVPVPTESDLE